MGKQPLGRQIVDLRVIALPYHNPKHDGVVLEHLVHRAQARVLELDPEQAGQVAAALVAERLAIPAARGRQGVLADLFDGLLDHHALAAIKLGKILNWRPSRR